MVVLDLKKETETEFPAYPIPRNARLPSDLYDLDSLKTRSSEVSSVFCSTVRDSLRGPSAPSTDVPLAVYEYGSVDEVTQVSYPPSSYGVEDLPVQKREVLDRVTIVTEWDPLDPKPKTKKQKKPKDQKEMHKKPKKPKEPKKPKKPKKQKSGPARQPTKWCVIDYPIAMTIIAVIQLLFAIGNLARAALAFSNPRDDTETNDVNTSAMEMVQIIVMIIWGCFCCTAFVGIYTRKVNYILPHFISSLVCLVALCAFFVVYCVCGFTPEIVVFAICIPILGWCLFIEWMYIQDLKYRKYTVVEYRYM